MAQRTSTVQIAATVDETRTNLDQVALVAPVAASVTLAVIPVTPLVVFPEPITTTPVDPRITLSVVEAPASAGQSTLFRPYLITNGPISGYVSSVRRSYGDIELALLEEIHKSIVGQNRENIPSIVKIAADAAMELLTINENDQRLINTRRIRSSSNDTLLFEKIEQNQGWVLESSRDSRVVLMSHLSVVKAFVDMDEWVSMFRNIVPRAIVLEQIQPVKDTFDETMQLVLVEYHTMATPIIPPRKSVFVRYCKKVEEGIWTLVDVSVDDFLPASAKAVIRCRRRPSGFVVDALPCGNSQVTCFEHMEVDDEPVEPLVRHILDTCHVYGARHWVAELKRQSKIPIGFTYIGNKTKLMWLSERMVQTFCGGITNSTVYNWKRISGDGIHEMRITTKEVVNDGGIKNGKFVAGSATFWLPVSPKLAFTYLCDERNRPRWDSLSIGGIVEKIKHYENDHEACNVVSMFKIGKIGSSTRDNKFILQETKMLNRTSYVVYAVVDRQSLRELLIGNSADNNISIAPCGFSILSCKTPPHYIAGMSIDQSIAAATTGTLLTVGCQVLIDSRRYSNNAASAEAESIKTVTNMVAVTMRNVTRRLLEARKG